MLIAGFSGGLAAFLTNPFTLISIRQMLDPQIKPEWRRNYGRLGNAFSEIKNNKFRGSFENVVRHILLNVSLTAPYDYFHESLYIKFGDYGFVEPIALALGAAVSTFVVLPFDTARTRVMQYHNQPERNRLQNRSLMNVLVNSLKYERTPFAMLAGYWTYYIYTLMYASLTIGITNRMCDSRKRANNLKENQI